jgi:hypothetical protein
MNRQERRRAAAIARTRTRDNKPYHNWVADLVHRQPALPLDALERGKAYHLVFQHEDWCDYWDGGACDCDPLVTLHEAK